MTRLHNWLCDHIRLRALFTLAIALSALLTVFALAATLTTSEGWQLVADTTSSQPSLDACIAAGNALPAPAKQRTWYCRQKLITKSGAVISWTTPTQNTDGTPLTNLAGYTLSYGVSPSTLTHHINLGAETLSYAITGLANGTWYFAVQTVNSDGVPSDPIGPVSAVVP